MGAWAVDWLIDLTLFEKGEELGIKANQGGGKKGQWKQKIWEGTEL